MLFRSYDNMEQRRPFALSYHVGAMYDGFEKLYAAASGKDCVIPGHDPLVMRRYPAARDDLEGVAVRLDLPPIA